MTTVMVRQLVGESIISIPEDVVKTLGLHVGSKLDLSIVDNKVVLTHLEKIHLEDLLAGSPRKCFKLTEEDRGWIDAKPVGKEI